MMCWDMLTNKSPKGATGWPIENACLYFDSLEVLPTENVNHDDKGSAEDNSTRGAPENKIVDDGGMQY